MSQDDRKKEIQRLTQATKDMEVGSLLDREQSSARSQAKHILNLQAQAQQKVATLQDSSLMLEQQVSSLKDMLSSSESQQQQNVAALQSQLQAVVAKEQKVDRARARCWVLKFQQTAQVPLCSSITPVILPTILQPRLTLNPTTTYLTCL